MSTSQAGPPALRAARDFLLLHRDDYPSATAGFRWPELTTFNFVTDWFDGLAAEQPDATALWLVDAPDSEGVKLSFSELAARSVAAAHWLVAQGIGRGDRLLLALGNCVPLWDIMLGAIRLGAVTIPATPQLAASDIADRVERGRVRLLIAHAEDAAKFAGVSPEFGKAAVSADAAADQTLPEGWSSYDIAPFTDRPADFSGVSKASDQLLLYFTSGTTAKPKLVEHTATSYPIGHLSTMYWLGVQPGDVHLNISSPGWAKHAWSNLFGPWLAGACVLVFTYPRFDAASLLRVLAAAKVTTFCAPPTVWRMLVQADLGSTDVSLRECLSAGEPLNPEVISTVRRAWGLNIRDGYGQTEMTCSVGNTPGSPIKDGSMGRPMPGYPVVLIDPGTGEISETDGELCLRLDPAPLPLMAGYKDDADTFDTELIADSTRRGYFHTGDVVSRDDDGYITFVGRADDVFKASDYRISPFELESVLIEHPGVAEVAVVPSPDPLRLAVPKAYVILAGGYEPNQETARELLAYSREHLAPYKRIKRLQFGELPKTISGKIRRVELRAQEERPDVGDGADARSGRLDGEFWASDFGL